MQMHFSLHSKARTPDFYEGRPNQGARLSCMKFTNYAAPKNEKTTSHFMSGRTVGGGRDCREAYVHRPSLLDHATSRADAEFMKLIAKKQEDGIITSV